jgi:hypothetical protein
MVGWPSGARRLYSVLGVVLLGVGLTILLAEVDTAASRLAERVGINSGEMGGSVPAAILTTVRAAQALAFDRANVLSAAREVLLSCWPVILVIVGAALLHGAFNGFARRGHNGATAAEGDA